MTNDPRREAVEKYTRAMEMKVESVRLARESENDLNDANELLNKAIEMDEVWVYDGLAYFRPTVGSSYIERRKVVSLDTPDTPDTP